MSENTILEGRYNAKNHNLSINGDSPFIDAYGTEITHFNFNGKANENTLDLIIGADKIYQSDSLFIDNFKLRTIAKNDSLTNNITWHNKKEKISKDRLIKLLKEIGKRL